MPIPKEPVLIVGFPTTNAALAAETCFQAAGLPGRLVPLPPQIAAGCGLAWRAPDDHLAPAGIQAALIGALDAAGIDHTPVYALML